MFVERAIRKLCENLGKGSMTLIPKCVVCGNSMTYSPKSNICDVCMMLGNVQKPGVVSPVKPQTSYHNGPPVPPIESNFNVRTPTEIIADLEKWRAYAAGQIAADPIARPSDKCEICGAILTNRATHAEFHKDKEKRLETEAQVLSLQLMRAESKITQLNQRIEELTFKLLRSQ